MFTAVSFSQSFEKYIGKKIWVDFVCEGETNDDGKVELTGEKRHAGGHEFLFLKDSRNLIWFRHGRINKYSVKIDSEGDLDITQTIEGKPLKWIQLLSDKEGRLQIWVSDSYLRYCRVRSHHDWHHYHDEEDEDVEDIYADDDDEYAYDDDSNNDYEDNSSDDESDDNSSDDGRVDVSEISDAEAKIAFEYLNKIRQNPSAYSQEIGVDLSGVKALHALKWNKYLEKAAQAKAEDMVKRGYFAHVDPDGYGMNIKIHEAGYTLSKSWISNKSDNFFESLYYKGGGDRGGIVAIRGLVNDGGADNDNAGHRRHILGIDSFWANCYDIGIGHAWTSDGRSHYYCVLVAKHN